MFKYLNKALKSVQTIDKNFNSIGTKADTTDKIKTLITRIDDKPEIKNVLSKFLIDLNKIGINQTVNRQSLSKTQYYIRLLKFRQLHNVFWDLCKEHEISQRNHKLTFDINNLGLLDPKHFPSETYKQLMSKKH